MTAVSSAGLWFSGDPELRGIAVLLWGFLAGMCALHIEVSRSLLASLRLQQASIRLSANLADEQDRLSQLNDQLTTTNSQLDHIARHDALTGLFNRRGTLEALEQVLADSAGRSVGLLFIDLDRFKSARA
jgi:predicted signal transduction protein with EAL and GGDEF domain